MFGNAGWRILVVPKKGKIQSYCISTMCQVAATNYVKDVLKKAGHTNKTCSMVMKGYGNFNSGDVHIDLARTGHIHEANFDSAS